VSQACCGYVDARSLHTPDASRRIADAILRLVEDPDRRRALGVAARRRAEERFSEKRLGKDLMAIFRGEPVCHPSDEVTLA